MAYTQIFYDNMDTNTECSFFANKKQQHILAQKHILMLSLVDLSL